MINEFRPMNHLTSLQNFICTIGNLPTSYALSLSYEEQIWWLCDFLEKKVFPAIEQNTNITEETQQAFIELQNYVRDYFNNLDVQDEINNKLDEMTESGVLQDILINYINVAKIYNTTIEMLSDINLLNNQKVKTLGYYDINDGGGAEFFITNTSNINKYQKETSNGLYAEMIIKNNSINFKQLGAKCNDNTFDNKNYLLEYVSICNKYQTTLQLIIDGGNWYFSPTHIQRIGGVIIKGIGNKGQRTFNSTTIKAINTQDYIWKFGGVSSMSDTNIPYNNTNTNNNISDLTFSSDYQINYGCLVLEYSNYGLYDNINFINIIGTGLYINTSWENYFGLLTFRQIKDFSKPCLYFAPAKTITNVSSNISSSSFAKLIFESISGDMIKIGDIVNDSYSGAGFVNNQFGEINIENSYSLQNNERIINFAENTNLDILKPLFLFNGNMSGVSIDVINFTGYDSYSKIVIDDLSGNNYFFKSLFNSIGGSNSSNYKFDVSINTIITRSLLQILTAIDPYAEAFSFQLGNFNSSSNASQIYSYTPFDVLNCGNIQVSNFQSRTNNYINNINLCNAIELYKNTPRGSIVSDIDALNPLKLCSKKGSGSTLTTFLKYPFEYSNENEKSNWLIRVKTDENGHYYFVLRGEHNGENVNTTYSANDLQPNTWYNIPITMNFDFNSPIKFINLGNKIDTLIFVNFS